MPKPDNRPSATNLIVLLEKAGAVPKGTIGSWAEYKSAMTINHADEPTSRKPLRLWPGVVAVVLQWLAWLVVPIVAADATMFAVIGALACGLAVVLWWLFFSRAPWSERVGAIVLMVVAVLATSRIVHQSIANGMMGKMLPVYAIPVLSLALVTAG